MKVITPGHKYALSSFEGGQDQHLQFIEKEKTTMNTINDGTTNEEVLSMLLNRMNFLNNMMPCRENSVAITKLDEALLWLNKRTNDRKSRGVEGTAKA